jgi:hypothetical protein
MRFQKEAVSREPTRPVFRIDPLAFRATKATQGKDMRRIKPFRIEAE